MEAALGHIMSVAEITEDSLELTASQSRCSLKTNARRLHPSAAYTNAYLRPLVRISAPVKTNAVVFLHDKIKTVILGGGKAQRAPSDSNDQSQARC